VNGCAVKSGAAWIPLFRRIGIRSCWLLTALVATGACAGEPRTGYLHVVYDRLPQCAYGVGFARPLVLELRQADRVVARSFTSGMSTDLDSLRVSLFVPFATSGIYEVHVGQCPDLHDDPQASVACESVEWVSSSRARLHPMGMHEPQTVRPRRLSLECLDGQTAYFP
jgi:hypothetical protein